MSCNYATFVIVYNNQGEAIGVIHLVDIVTLCCNNFLRWNTAYEFCFHSKEEFSITPVKQLLDNKKWKTMSFLAPFLDVIKAFSDSSVGEIAVIGDDSADVLTVITRLEVTNFLYEHRKELGEVLKKRIRHCHINYQFDPRINKIEFAIEAFSSLWSKQKSGFLTCHGNGFSEKFFNLIVQVMLVQVHSDLCANDNIAAVFEEDTLEKVLELVGKRCVQRIFVTDDKRKPIGELTLCDILAEFHVINRQSQ